MEDGKERVSVPNLFIALCWGWALRARFLFNIVPNSPIRVKQNLNGKLNGLYLMRSIEHK
jgi:hypothetical protein